MFIVNSYSIAVVLCVFTMLCWGSWANTMNLKPKTWPNPLFYWDYCLGIVLLSLLFGLTLGSLGDQGRPFFQDLGQASSKALGSAFLGGVVFNLSNLLWVAAAAVAGMSVAFPIAVGLALVIGVILNYIAEAKGDPVILFTGVGLVVLAIVVNALAYRTVPVKQKGDTRKGIVLSVLAGIIMGFFYRFVAGAVSMNFTLPEAGMLTPYSAVFIFSVGCYLSGFIWNTYFMYRPIEGVASTYKQYFTETSLKVHWSGILGGVIWAMGLSFSIIAAEQAGPAISYGLGQGSTMVGAAWGVFVWREFKLAPRKTNWLLLLMFASFIAGLIMITLARNA
ncbi:MAG: multidrug DMT transporter permease [Bacteroidales bacterium]|nr:MAG: multidrug DMT transporter permease [Bacteroidales bacterium]